MPSIANIFWLGTKEIRSFLRDFVLLGLVIYSFSLALIAQAFLPPYFQKPQPVAERDIVPLMNAGRYTFIIDIPAHFQRDLLAGLQPAIQLNVDATAMIQAGLGADYAQQIILTEVQNFLSRAEGG